MQNLKMKEFFYFLFVKHHQSFTQFEIITPLFNLLHKLYFTRAYCI